MPKREEASSGRDAPAHACLFALARAYSANASYLSPCAWATGSLVNFPCHVFTALAKCGSALASFAAPWLAILIAQGSVALVRACVLVRATAPGMLPTQ